MSSKYSFNFTSTSKEEYKVHHCHKYGDLELRSSEGIVFRVDSRRLASVSGVFESMIEVGSSGPSSGKAHSYITSDPLEIHTSSETLENFLDMISITTPQAPNLEFGDTLSLYEFCDKYDINSHIENLVKTHLLEETDAGGQWALLVWSAKIGNVQMAKEALRRMTTYCFTRPQIPTKNKQSQYQWECILFWDIMTKLPLSWQYQILRLTILSPGHDEPYQYAGHMYGSHYRQQNYSGFKVCEDWMYVANSFNPKA